MTIQQIHRTTLQRILGRPMAALALLSAVGCSTSTPLQRSREYLREGHVQLAFAELELEYTAQRAAGTVDDELAVAHQELYPRYLTERGRLAIYDDHELQTRRRGGVEADRPGQAQARQ